MLILSKESIFFPLIVLGILYLKEVSCDGDDATVRNNRHFSLFSVVTFKNDECTSESTYNGGAVRGTCYSTTECGDKSGVKSGNCASGFGVCCVFMYSLLSDTTISENRTYFQNPLYPNIETTGAGTNWKYTINKMQSDICQLRLDFEYFVIVGPASIKEKGTATEDGNCADSFKPTLGGGAYIPTLCGVMTGQHLYMDMGMDATDTASLAMALVATGTTSYANAFRKFRVLTSQIPCWAPYRAPDGCNQYFTTLVGQIVSPNFSNDPAGTRADGQLNSAMDLMSQDLKYCIRREMNTCCILYQVCNQFEGADLTHASPGGNVADGEAGIISEGWSFHTAIKNAGTIATLASKNNDVGLVDGACSQDYIEILESSPMQNLGGAVQVNSRYCGHRFGQIPSVIIANVGDNSHQAIWDCTEPFEVVKRTDQYNDKGESAIAQVKDGIRGLCLDFTQEQC